MVENHESVQLALFLLESPGLSALELWNLIFDQPVSGFQTIGEQHTQANGNTGNLSCTLSAQPTRVDLIVQGMPTSNAPAFPSSIVDIDNTIQISTVSLLRCLSRLKVGRVAAVLQGTTHVRSREEASAKVKEMIPGLPGPPSATEITYQIIVGRRSIIEPSRNVVQILRCQSVQMQTIEVKSNQMAATSTIAHAAHLYIDVATESFENLNENTAGTALNEVIDFAKKIYKGGIDAIA